ncbi:MAG: ketopantoate reductase family protein [Christensenellaceae bacterium]|jgi:2-dehydropantoate 2-reductase
MMKIGIYGAGSLGTILGAYISKAGIQIDLINRNKAHVAALNENGATVTGTVSFSTPVHAITPEEMTGEYDLLFLMTKQTQNQEIVSYLKAFLSPTGTLCTMQNGLPEPGIAEILGEARVVGCVVEWGATLSAPGVSELTSAPDSLSFEIGRLNGSVDDALYTVKEVLEHMCPVTIEENFMGVRWSKLLINAAFSGVSSVLGETFGAAAKEKASRYCIQRVIKECIDVAKAAKIEIAPVQGKDIVKLLDYHGWLKEKISFFIIPIAIKKHANLRASMLQDLEQGKKTEVDDISGVVSAWGKRYGVATPYNDKVIHIIHQIEAGKRTAARENVALFSQL